MFATNARPANPVPTMIGLVSAAFLAGRADVRNM
jgi:hypothetical protein